MRLHDPRAGWRDDLRVLRQFLRGKPRSADHAADLDAFYGPQAHAYDRFRERLLPGRRAFMEALPLAPGARVIDFGAGTGRHWLYVEDRLASVGQLDLVDLCEPLLAIARERYADVPQVRVVRADAQSWRAGEPADAILFSYSLSMIPDGRAALANACAQLKPGGLLALIDFCTLPATLPPSPRAPVAPLGAWERRFWPRWFGHDGVMLRPEVLPALVACGPTVVLRQAHARLPYLPVLRAPWFYWIGLPEHAPRLP